MVSLPGPDGEGNEAWTVGLEIGDFVIRRESAIKEPEYLHPAAEAG